jgi:hypothetical protein
MKDLTNNIQVLRSISPVSVSDNTAQAGQAIDRLGYESVTYVLNIGSIADADATFTVLLQECDTSGGSYTDVADADMISQTPGTAPETAAGFQFDDDNEVRKLGYIGNKRYTKLTITPVNNASAAVISAVAILGNPTVVQPVVQASA